MQINFNWKEDSDEAVAVTGTVANVLYSAESSGASEGDTANYAVYIDFDADEDIRIGMTATVRPIGSATVEVEEDREEVMEEAAIEN